MAVAFEGGTQLWLGDEILEVAKSIIIERGP
jgi:hypothetical protein